MYQSKIVFTACLVLSTAASSLQAQRGNASDVGGRPPLFPPGNANGRSGAPLPGNSPRSVVFSGAVGVAATPASPGAVTIALAPIQQSAGVRAAQLAADVGASRTRRIELVDAILNAPGAPTASQVERFVAEYSSMLADPSTTRIAAASSAFNALVDRASSTYLTKPPAEFVAARAILRELVETTSRR